MADWLGCLCPVRFSASLPDAMRGSRSATSPHSVREDSDSIRIGGALFLLLRCRLFSGRFLGRGFFSGGLFRCGLGGRFFGGWLFGRRSFLGGCRLFCRGLFRWSSFLGRCFFWRGFGRRLFGRWFLSSCLGGRFLLGYCHSVSPLSRRKCDECENLVNNSRSVVNKYWSSARQSFFELTSGAWANAAI